MIAIRQAAFEAAIKLYPTTPPPVLALALALIEDHLGPARLDAQGYEITTKCTSADLFSNPEDAATVDRWVKEHFVLNQICDECGNPLHRGIPEKDRPELESAGILGMSAADFKFFFVCEWCYENYQALDERGLPNIWAQLVATINRMAPVHAGPQT